MSSFGRVIYSYESQESDELDVSALDIIELLHLNDDGWWMAIKGSKIGLVPENYVKVEGKSIDVQQQVTPIQKVEDEEKELTSKVVKVKASTIDDTNPNMKELQRLKEQRLQADAKMESIRNSLTAIQLSGWNKPNVTKQQPPSQSQSQSEEQQEVASDYNSNTSTDNKMTFSSSAELPTNLQNQSSIPQSSAKRVSKGQNSMISPLSNRIPKQHRDVEVVEGICYPLCKSVVYTPSAFIASNIVNGPPEETLAIDHIYGYNWNHTKELPNSLMGKSLISTDYGYTLFSAAKVVVIMKTNSPKQKYFTEHTDTVTCLTCHPSHLFVASGQMDPKGMILIWNIKSVVSAKSKKFPTVQLYTNRDNSIHQKNASNYYGVISLDFSGDGKFLLCVDSEYNVFMYDWALSTLVSRTKLDGTTLSDIRFNPYSYMVSDMHTIEEINANNKNDSQEIANYTIVSTHNMNVKFWTFQCMSTLQSDTRSQSTNSSGNKNASNSKDTKQLKRKRIETFEFQCSDGVIPKSHNLPPTDFISIGFLPSKSIQKHESRHDDSNNNESNNTTVSASSLSHVHDNHSLILTSTSSGAVFIWEQLYDASKTSKSISSWNTSNRLISVVLDMHSSPIINMLYITSQQQEILLSASANGELSFWDISRVSTSNSTEKDTSKLKMHESVALTPSSCLKTITMPNSAVVLTNTANVSTTGEMTLDTMSIAELQSKPKKLETTLSNKHVSKHVNHVIDMTWDENHNQIILGGTNSHIYKMNILCNREVDASDLSSLSSLEVLNSGHADAVSCIVPHPIHANIFMTVSSVDRSIKVWNGSSKQLITDITLDSWSPTCAAFVPDINSTEDDNSNIESDNVDDAKNKKILTFSSSIIIGSDEGEIALLSIDSLSHIHELENENENDGMIRNDNFTFLARKRIASKLSQHVNSSTNTYNKSRKDLNSKSQVSMMKYSPDGRMFAVVCQGDKLIHILSTQHQYRRIAVCRGHTANIVSFDISKDSKYMQSNSSGTSNDILYWEMASGQLITDTYRLRDVEWETWNCRYGWPVQGIFNVASSTHHHRQPQSLNHVKGVYSSHEEVYSVDKSRSGKLCVVSSHNSSNDNDICRHNDSIKLFRYPCLLHGTPNSYRGHASIIRSVAFLGERDENILSSGDDTCIFQWKICK